jgi:hypothetical protein
MCFGNSEVNEKDAWKRQGLSEELLIILAFTHVDVGLMGRPLY